MVPACICADRRRSALNHDRSAHLQAVNVISQAEDGPVGRLCARAGVNSNSCGFIAMAVAELLAQDSRPVMGNAELATLTFKLRDADVMLPRIEAAIKWVCNARRQYMEAMPDEFASAAKRAAFLGDVVREPEVSAWLRSGGPSGDGSVHILRSIQLGPSRLGMIRWGDADCTLGELDHEDERRFTREEAPLRTADGADWFFESHVPTLHELNTEPSSSLPATMLPPTMVPPPVGALRSADDWSADVGSCWAAELNGTSILVNWWGHWGVYLPVHLAASEEEEEGEKEKTTPTARLLLIFNSIADVEDESLQAVEVMRCCFGAEGGSATDAPKR